MNDIFGFVLNCIDRQCGCSRIARTYIHAMPFCHIRHKVERPTPYTFSKSSYPKSLNILGDHIRKRRLKLELFQKQVGQLIGVDEATIYNWEAGDYEPETRYLPKIYDFLGYCPIRYPKTFGEKLRVWRESLGLTQEQLAQGMGVDETTIREWEIGQHSPTKRSLEKISAFLK